VPYFIRHAAIAAAAAVLMPPMVLRRLHYLNIRAYSLFIISFSSMPTGAMPLTSFLLLRTCTFTAPSTYLLFPF